MNEELSRKEELTNGVVEAVKTVEVGGTQKSATGRLRPG